jgi:hypothetical protein
MDEAGNCTHPSDTDLLLTVAREAAAFLDSWFPQTDRFIEATLPLDNALNAVANLLGGDDNDA